MCGIAGFKIWDKARYSDKHIINMLSPLSARGPDGFSWMNLDTNGTYSWRKQDDGKAKTPSLIMALGCCRLAIQDNSHMGLQPISSSSKNIWVVHNGEIYNFVELRQDLRALGHVFRSKTDTEVIANAYEEWGLNCFSKFNGKFAIVIFDCRDKSLILARDRLGVVPLFYQRDTESVRFSSEIKSILAIPSPHRSINLERLAALIGLPYKLHSEGHDSLFQEIKQVRPGEYLIFKDNGASEGQQYWTLDSIAQTPVDSFLDARAYLRELLINSVEIRMRSDRRFAFIVSGGIDSPATIGIATQIYGIEPETFSLDIPGSKFNERESIQEVVNYNKVKSNLISITPDIVANYLPKAIDLADEPLPTPNAILHTILAHNIHEKGFHVVLNGVGGDEVFFGYHDQLLYLLNELEQSCDPTFPRELAGWQRNQRRPIRVYEKFCAFLHTDEYRTNPDFLAQSKGMNYWQCLTKDMQDNIHSLSNSFRMDDYSTRSKQVADITRLTLPYALRMDDNCYMAHAVESRQPFLDYRLLEFGLRLPPKFKAHRGISKFLLRSAVREFIPKTRRRDFRKIGLNFPIDQWMRGPLKPWLFNNLLVLVD